MSNQEIVDYCNKLLDDNPKWIELYKTDAEILTKNENNYKKKSHLFQVNKPLYRYTTISRVKGWYQYDLRFRGQSVGEISVSKGKITLKAEPEVNPKGGNYFNWNKSYNGEWKKAVEFRKHFRDLEEISAKTKSPEHCVENLMLAEFAKHKSTDKQLLNIQPIKLCGFFFQLTTPLKASNHQDIKFAGAKGGGIDILARVRHHSNECHICVMELKDQNTESEPQSAVIQQAIAYATFLGNLLTTEGAGSKEWFKLMGFNGKMPNHISIDVATVMPNTLPDTCKSGEELQVNERVSLHLFSLFFDSSKNWRFSGTLKDEID